jgi:transposase
MCWRSHLFGTGGSIGGCLIVVLMQVKRAGVLSMQVSAVPLLEQLVVPALRPSDTVAMDNLSSHKDPAIRRAVRSTGAKLSYLPQYSPDLNPIEQALAMLKTLLRKHNARSFEELEAAICHLLPKLTPQQCANFSSRPAYAAT